MRVGTKTIPRFYFKGLIYMNAFVLSLKHLQGSIIKYFVICS